MVSLLDSPQNTAQMKHLDIAENILIYKMGEHSLGKVTEKGFMHIGS